MSLRKFMCLQASTTQEQAGCPSPSPSQMQEMYAKFTAWRERYEDHIIDMGGKLGGEARTVSAHGQIDGPLVEVKELIGGYMIIAAENMEEAARIAQESPGGSGSSTVTIREIITS